MHGWKTEGQPDRERHWAAFNVRHVWNKSSELNLKQFYWNTQWVRCMHSHHILSTMEVWKLEQVTSIVQQLTSWCQLLTLRDHEFVQCLHLRHLQVSHTDGTAACTMVSQNRVPQDPLVLHRSGQIKIVDFFIVLFHFLIFIWALLCIRNTFWKT